MTRLITLPAHDVLDRSEHEDRYCGNCAHYRPESDDHGQCLVPYIRDKYGPIVDRLWCSDFYERA